MKQADVLDRLKNDEDYYGAFGKQYLSNSDIGTLFKNPMDLGKPTEKTVPMLIGGYLHTCILEPEKLHTFKIIPASTRNTKQYKEISGGELCLLQHEVDRIELLRDTILNNDICRDLIKADGNEYEKPAITDLFGNKWKGKADIINHNEKLIIDIKTTSDIDGFKWSAKKYNYDSQAYIYSQMFGYEFLFIAIDKNTQKIKFADCSTAFYESGAEKVERANEAYNLYFKDENFEERNFFETETL